MKFLNGALLVVTLFKRVWFLDQNLLTNRVLLCKQSSFACFLLKNKINPTQIDAAETYLIDGSDTTGKVFDLFRLRKEGMGMSANNQVNSGSVSCQDCVRYFIVPILVSQMRETNHKITFQILFEPTCHFIRNGSRVIIFYTLTQNRINQSIQLYSQPKYTNFQTSFAENSVRLRKTFHGS